MNRRGFVARVLGVLAVGPLAKYLPAAEPDWKTLPGTPTPITFTVGEDEVFSLSKSGQWPLVFDEHTHTFTFYGNLVTNSPRQLGVITGISEG